MTTLRSSAARTLPVVLWRPISNAASSSGAGRNHDRSGATSRNWWHEAIWRAFNRISLVAFGVLPLVDGRLDLSVELREPFDVGFEAGDGAAEGALVAVWARSAFRP